MLAPRGDLFDVKLHKRGLPIGNLTSQFFASVYLNPLDDFVKHELRLRGYVRYLDDFLLFGDDRYELSDRGARCMPGSRSCGSRWTGQVPHVANPARSRFRRIRGICRRSDSGAASTMRRFSRGYRRMLWERRHRCRPAAEVTQSVKAWVAHTSHAQSVGLRRVVLGRRRAAGLKERTKSPGVSGR